MHHGVPGEKSMHMRTGEGEERGGERERESSRSARTVEDDDVLLEGERLRLVSLLELSIATGG